MNGKVESIQATNS